VKSKIGKMNTFVNVVCAFCVDLEVSSKKFHQVQNSLFLKNV
jgi:hypothetical protein